MHNKQPARRYMHRGVHCFDIEMGQILIEKAVHKPFRILLQNELE